MASCSMASAASGFLLTPNVTGNASSASKTSMAFFPSKNSNNNSNSSRLVVRAAEEAAAPAPATTTAPPEAPKPKPAPIGPKRGTKVSNVPP